MVLSSRVASASAAGGVGWNLRPSCAELVNTPSGFELREWMFELSAPPQRLDDRQLPPLPSTKPRPPAPEAEERSDVDGEEATAGSRTTGAG